MLRVKYLSDSIQWDVNELTSRIIAESGIPTDRFHLGKILLQTFKDYPDLTLQIDGATGESETYGSVLIRSVRCAIRLRKLGLKRGDVMILMAPHHLDLSVPFYAALYLGIIIAPVDRTYGISDLTNMLSINKPDIIFCQSEKLSDIKVVLSKLDQRSKIVTFDKGDEYCFSNLMDQCEDEETVESFKPTDFDPEATIAFLVQTSGTTGPSKSAALTHKNFAVTGPYFWSWITEFPMPIHLSLILSPINWITTLIQYIVGPYVKIPRVQSSLPITIEHTGYLINTYKPSFTAMNPIMLTSILKSEDCVKCDLTCFDTIMLAGSSVQTEHFTELKRVAPKTKAINIYGITEISGLAFLHQFSSIPESCGKPIGTFQYRLVNIDTGKVIDEPNVPAELWLKGPGVFKGYYNNPTATADVLAEGDWYKTGDMFYRDEHWNYYYMERVKLLLKYKGVQIFPAEIEGVIRQHPGVLAVAVTGVPDPECGDLPVACVVPRPGYEPTAQEIKDLVKDSLADTKQLRGGVVFMDTLPVTTSGKIHRYKLKGMIPQMRRE